MTLARMFAAALAGLISTAFPAGAEVAKEFKLVILGTGTPIADPDRSGPALAFIVDGKSYLVDAGPGIVRRAAAAERKGIGALDVEKLDTVFLTHLHSDHTLGLPDLIYSPWVLDREAPLRLFGPPGVRKMAAHLQKAFAEDIDLRLNGIQPSTPEGWKTNVTEIKSGGRIFEEGALEVDAIPVPHGQWTYAYGYKFTAHGKTIVVSGDTAKSETILEAARGADILVHEVISEKGLNARPPEWQTYHHAYHTTTTELADIAREAKPKLLVLYHQLYEIGDAATDADADLVAEIRAAGYDGAIVSAMDLDMFEP